MQNVSIPQRDLSPRFFGLEAGKLVAYLQEVGFYSRPARH
jgi:hypothetical protein